MKRALATLWTGGESGTSFVVMRPDFNEPGFYRQTLSLDAFKNREALRLYDSQQRGDGSWKNLEWCSIKYEHDFLPDSKWDTIEASTNGKTWEDLPVYPTVWDFYKAINYDYKKKRYNDA